MSTLAIVLIVILILILVGAIPNAPWGNPGPWPNWLAVVVVIVLLILLLTGRL